MSTFLVLLRKELLEQWRTMRLPSFLVVFFFVGVLSPATARYLPRLLEALGGAAFAAAFPAPTIQDAYAQLAKNVGQLGTLVVIVISMAAVSSERERGTLAFLFSKPVARGSFLAAKLAGLGATLLLGTLLAGAVAYLYTALLFAPPTWGFVLLCLASFLTLLVFAAITLAASAITGSAVAAGGTGIVALLVFGMLSILPAVGPYAPTGALARATEIMSGASPETLLGPLVAQVGIVAVAFAVSLAAFSRQEF